MSGLWRADALQGYLRRAVVSCVGLSTHERAYHYCRACQEGRILDERLDLSARECSPRPQRLAAFLSFGVAAHALRECHDVEVSAETVR